MQIKLILIWRGGNDAAGTPVHGFEWWTGTKPAYWKLLSKAGVKVDLPKSCLLLAKRFNQELRHLLRFTESRRFYELIWVTRPIITCTARCTLIQYLYRWSRQWLIRYLEFIYSSVRRWILDTERNGWVCYRRKGGWGGVEWVSGHNLGPRPHWVLKNWSKISG